MLQLVRSRRTLRSALSLGRLVGGGLLVLFVLSCDNASEFWANERWDLSISYTCISTDDVACEGYSNGSLTRGTPRVIAVGGRFRASFFEAVPASPQIIERDGNELEFLRPGYGAMLGSFDGAPAFVHLKAAHVASVGLKSNWTVFDNLDLGVGGGTQLTATPYDEDGEPLAGLVNYRWSVDNESVVRISLAGRTVEVQALAPGVAVVRVEVGTRAFGTFTVRVNPSPVDSTSPVVDGGLTDAGTELLPDAGVTSDAGVSGSSDVNLDGGITSDAVDTGETRGDTSSGSSAQLTDAATDGGQL